jgi:hypothetical protein
MKVNLSRGQVWYYIPKDMVVAACIILTRCIMVFWFVFVGAHNLFY